MMTSDARAAGWPDGACSLDLQQGINVSSVGRPIAGSSLVRRLVLAKNDPAKQRIRAWLSDIDDERLFSLGFTSEDIAALRGTAGAEVSKE
jgi:hypothetical protein